MILILQQLSKRSKEKKKEKEKKKKYAVIWQLIHARMRAKMLPRSFLLFRMTGRLFFNEFIGHLFL